MVLLFETVRQRPSRVNVTPLPSLSVPAPAWFDDAALEAFGPTALRRLFSEPALVSPPAVWPVAVVPTDGGARRLAGAMGAASTGAPLELEVVTVEGSEGAPTVVVLWVMTAAAAAAAAASSAAFFSSLRRVMTTGSEGGVSGTLDGSTRSCCGDTDVVLWLGADVVSSLLLGATVVVGVSATVVSEVLSAGGASWAEAGPAPTASRNNAPKRPTSAAHPRGLTAPILRSLLMLWVAWCLPATGAKGVVPPLNKEWSTTASRG